MSRNTVVAHLIECFVLPSVIISAGCGSGDDASSKNGAAGSGGSVNVGGGSAGGAIGNGGSDLGGAIGNGGSDAGGGQAGGTGGQAGSTGALGSLEIGTVKLIGYQSSCDASFGPPVGATSNSNFQCAVVSVLCPGQGDDDVQAEVALTGQANGLLGKGVVVTHAGQTGTNFGGQLSQALYDDGWDLAQIAWAAPWECPKHQGAQCAPDNTPEDTRPGIKNAGCRPATLIKWIHDNAKRVDGTAFLSPTKPFCGHGSSGGSGALWYSLVHYGSSAQLDFALIAASSPFGRIDIGCNPDEATTKITPACQNVVNPPQVPVGPLPKGALNTWFSTNTCDTAPSDADLALWSRNSIVSQGANFNFPTPVSTYNCVDLQTINAVPGLGAYVFNALHANDPQSLRFRSTCSVTGTYGNGCTGEQVFEDQKMVDIALDDMDQNCKILSR